MPALLIPICFALLVSWLRRSGRASGLRDAILSAAMILGLWVAVTVELLSLLMALSAAALTLTWLAAALSLAVAAARVGPRPRPLPIKLGRPSPATLLLLLPTAAIVGLTGLTAALAWPNTSDALAYHLARVMHWVQNGSVAFYPTSIVRQLFNPPWGEYTVLHLILLGGGDRSASLVQWLAMLGSLIGASLIAARLGAATRGQLAAALLCATIPMGVLQASSTQVDHVTAFWLVSLAASLLALRDQPASTARALGVGGALGLALFSKGTAYLFALPWLSLFWLPLIGRSPHIWLRQSALIGLIALAVNAPLYWRNLEVFGSPLGPTARERPEEWQIGAGLRNEGLDPALFASNLVRNAALHFGTPWPSVTTAVERAVRDGHAALGLDVKDPRTTWYGHGFNIPDFNTNEGQAGSPLHLLLILGALAVLVGSPALRRNDPLARYALAAVLAYLLFSAMVKWQPWQARLQLPLFVLWTPVLGVVIARHVRLFAVVAVLALVLAVPFLLAGRSHPLVGEASVLRSGRAEQMFRYRPNLREGYVESTRQVRAAGCLQVGLLLDWDDWEYPFWSLLPEARAGGRIEHVAVQTSAAILPTSPPFVPCAVLAVGGRAPDTLQIDGRTYRRDWAGSGVKLLKPAG